jgi:drug/metabolite transporter (DMT)-like permease
VEASCWSEKAVDPLTSSGSALSSRSARQRYFATRDNLVRWLAIDSDVSPELAAAVTLGVGTLAIGTWLVLARRLISLRPLPRFAPAGLLFGLSYICIFEAFYRGPVTVVSPLVATESLWASYSPRSSCVELKSSARDLSSAPLWSSAAAC